MGLRIVVLVKHVPNIHSNRTFVDGRVARGAADGSLNELDENPLEEAVRLLERMDDDARASSEIIALTMGPAEASDALRRAYQLGAHVGVHVSDETLAGSDYLGTAAVLAAAVRRIAQDGPVDLVLAGMAALDGLGSVVPALVSAELGWAQLTNAGSLVVEDGTARVERDIDGVTEVLEAELPAVVSVNDHINRPRFPNFQLIMAARTKAITALSLADLGVDPASVGSAGARTRVTSAAPRPERPPVELHVDDGEGGIALVEFLARRGLVWRGMPDMNSTTKAVVLVDSLSALLRDADLELVTIARSLGDVVVVSFDAPGREVLDQLGAYGVGRAVELAVDGEAHLTGVAAQALTHVTDGARVLLARATFAHKEVLARLAHLTGAGLIIDAAQVGQSDEGAPRVVGAKRVFAGTWDLVCEVDTPLALLTVRPNSVRPAPADRPTTPVVETVAVGASEAQAAAGGVRLVSRTVHAVDETTGPALAEAAAVVAGGRGTGGDFGPVRDLADALGAAVGSTRDCVDEGWIEHDTQIGQTGVTISPRLYVGAGISGAPHHRGGMQASEVIVAVNSDPECPIFEICDFAVVGDLATVLPQAAAAIRARRT